MKRTKPVIPSKLLTELVPGMGETGFQGRTLGESFGIWKEMIEDEDCTILMGLSGAMIPAGMQKCLTELAEHCYIDAVVSTGANIFHDTCEHTGIGHYIGHQNADDSLLYSKGIDRIYNVFAYENEFRSMDHELCTFIEGLSPFNGSSREFTALLADYLKNRHPGGNSFLSACRKKDIPVFIPAICDSSIGIALLMARRRGAKIDIDQIMDTDEVAEIVERSKKTGVVFIGGGVPKNFIQQTQVIASIHNNNQGGHAYAIQYTTDVPHWGGLSGCTLEEGVSWGKEAPEAKKVQCFCDATIAIPVITSALIGSETKRNVRNTAIINYQS